MSHPFHSKFFDILAGIVGPAVVAFASVESIEAVMKVLVLILTVIFIAMGIAMRVMKIRKASIEEEEED